MRTTQSRTGTSARGAGITDTAIASELLSCFRCLLLEGDVSVLRQLGISILALSFVLSCLAQQPPTRKAPPSVPDLGRPRRISTVPQLPEGLPIKLRLIRTIDPREVKRGDRVPFVLSMDLYYRDVLVAKEGTEVIGFVEEAQGSGMFGQGSKLTLVIKMLSMVNAEELPLQGTAGARGSSDSQSDRYGWDALGASPYNPPMGIALAVFWWAMPGENVKLPKDTLVVASIARTTKLKLDTLGAFQPQKTADAKATINVVRGWIGAVRGADFYCNGIPIAHLPYKRLLQLGLEQGWYRFSIKPKKPPLELFVVAGQTYNLIADFQSVAEIPLSETNENTTNFRPFGKKRDFAELMQDARPVSPQDLYDNTCAPLSEELIPPVVLGVPAMPEISVDVPDRLD